MKKSIKNKNRSTNKKGIYYSKKVIKTKKGGSSKNNFNFNSCSLKNCIDKTNICSMSKQAKCYCFETDPKNFEKWIISVFSNDNDIHPPHQKEMINTIMSKFSNGSTISEFRNAYEEGKGDPESSLKNIRKLGINEVSAMIITYWFRDNPIVKDIEQEDSCAICGDKYSNTNKKYYMCNETSHTMCNQCIQNWIHSEEDIQIPVGTNPDGTLIFETREKPGTNRFKCPFCRKPICSNWRERITPCLTCDIKKKKYGEGNVDYNKRLEFSYAQENQNHPLDILYEGECLYCTENFSIERPAKFMCDSNHKICSTCMKKNLNKWDEILPASSTNPITCLNNQDCRYFQNGNSECKDSTTTDGERTCQVPSNERKKCPICRQNSCKNWNTRKKGGVCNPWVQPLVMDSEDIHNNIYNQPTVTPTFSPWLMDLETPEYYGDIPYSPASPQAEIPPSQPILQEELRFDGNNGPFTFAQFLEYYGDGWGIVGREQAVQAWALGHPAERLSDGRIATLRIHEREHLSVGDAGVDLNPEDIDPDCPYCRLDDVAPV